MPLHLLGKKSWNVYNQDNIARVRRDEAEADAQEDERDRRTQAVDAERRLQRLRGEAAEDPPVQADGNSSIISRSHDQGPSRKRRKIAGEDDTDRDIRLAQDELITHSASAPVPENRNEPLTDTKGHINLFPEGRGRREKNTEAEAEKSIKRREYEDQYTMRLSNAAGVKQGLGAPWYSTIALPDDSRPSKNVWGNEDKGRRERDKLRADANDPLATMKRGVKQLRDVERGRTNWVKERERELEELKSFQASTRTKKRRSRSDEVRHTTTSSETVDMDARPVQLGRDGRRHDRLSHRASPHRHSKHKRRHCASDVRES